MPWNRGYIDVSPRSHAPRPVRAASRRESIDWDSQDELMQFQRELRKNLVYGAGQNESEDEIVPCRRP